MIVIYDSKCGFCTAFTSFVNRNTRKGKDLELLDLRSAEGRAALKAKQVHFVTLNTIYCIDGSVYKKSAAIFRILRRLKLPFALLFAFSILPVSFTDKVYDFVAKRRYWISEHLGFAKKAVAPLLLMLLWLAPVATQARVNVDKAKLDRLFETLHQNRLFMGTIAVSVDGQLVYQNTKGFRDSTAKGILWPDENTKYRIGSITKMFTANIILQLIEEGKLNFDTRLSTFYPQIPESNNITIQQLLTHRSGLLRAEENKKMDKLNEAKNEEDLIRKLASYPLTREDTAEAHYSNVNYLLLGLIIQKVTNSDFDTQLRLRITDKLGLKNTYNLQRYIDATKNEAHSFHLNNGKWVEDLEWQANVTTASGYMVSTTPELCTFINALFAGRLVSDTMLKRMIATKGKYGMGILTMPFDEHMSYGHTGRLEGFVSTLGYFPDDKMSIAFIDNGQVYPMNDILIGVLSILFEKEYTIPDFTPIALTQNQLKQYEGRYKNNDLNYIMTLDATDAGLKASIKQQGGIFKQSFELSPLKNNFFICNDNGITAKFFKEKGSEDWQPTLKISGATLEFSKMK